jgi:GNAT superfamily N-acetyltransferase
MAEYRIVDVTDGTTFTLIPPCADPRFDHRSCDYWEDADRGSKAARPAWLKTPDSPDQDGPGGPPRSPAADNPFAPVRSEPTFNPFSRGASDEAVENPFAPTTRRERPVRAGVPPKLALLDRGRGVFGSYAKVLLVDDEPAAYTQFGPLSAYPRATRLRDLYPHLPSAPLPAVITCIASTAEARRQGHARRLVAAVCDDLAARGFAAVEAYPDLTRAEDETSAARPPFWHSVGFATAVDDERFPVMRRELH